ncbi:MAG: argininosuccinate lyase [Methanobacteriota archaeon]
MAHGPAAPFLSSLASDVALASADVAGTIAHVAMLRHAGIVTRREAKSLVAALQACHAEITSGTFPWHADLEDVHTNVEARVAELTGAAGRKVHAGRSRNDQVALAERLYLRTSIERILGKLLAFEKVLLERAKAHADVVVPAYTHLRKAQPVLLGHVLLANLWRLARDAARLTDAYARTNVSPAGAAAVAGTSLPLDPAVAAGLLGFDRAFANSADATSDRDHLVEVTSALALLAVHLSGLAEDLILWTSDEFSIASFAADDAAGSSFLPHKANPDVAELVRGRTGAIVGDLVGLLTALKGLPMGYHRDLQVEKASAMHAIETTGASLDALTDAVAHLTVHADGALASLDATHASGLFVEHLILNGVTHRDAYDLVKANLAAFREAAHDADPVTALRKISPLFGASALPLLTPRGAVDAVVSHGGTGPAQVAHQIAEAEAALGRQAFDLNLIAKKNRRIADVLSGEVGL